MILGYVSSENFIKSCVSPQAHSLTAIFFIFLVLFGGFRDFLIGFEVLVFFYYGGSQAKTSTVAD